MNGLLSSLASVHWLRPQWLWALVALPVLALWWRRRWRERSPWREAVDPHLLAHLLDPSPQARGTGTLWLGVLAVALAICALAGPSWTRAPQPQWQNRSPLVIAIDLSTASLANDLPPSRLLQARAKIATLLQSRAGGEVALVAFADDAFTVAPLTNDAANVALFLDSLAPDVMPVDGSRADRAIAWSARLLRQGGFRRGDILLLTDHAGEPARAAAAAASREGYRVSVLGMGTDAGAAYRDAEGRIAHARLDGSSLRAVASRGDGGYAAMAAGRDDLQALGLLDPGGAVQASAHGQAAPVWRDQGYWLLPPVLLLGLFAFRRGRGVAVLVLCAWLPWQPVHAGARDWWLRPDQQAHARILDGAQAYRKGDFATAQRLWRDIPTADAAYNRGNALAREGDYDQAIAAYDEALRLQPGMADAEANKRAVEAARRRQAAPGHQSGQSRKDDGTGRRGAQDGQQQPGQQQGGQQRPGQDDSTRQPPGQSQPASQAQQGRRRAPSPTPGDQDAQRQADADQRARMQAALKQAAAGKQPTQAGRAGQRPETQAGRERRLANEAWLRRVPDDPGGLLRARFQLEYERRQQGGE